MEMSGMDLVHTHQSQWKDSSYYVKAYVQSTREQ